MQPWRVSGLARRIFMKFIFAGLLLLTVTAAAEPLRLSGQQTPRQGEIVRLPDGRLVPYSTNPAERVICDDTCQPETSRHRAYSWLLAGAIAGGILMWPVLTESKLPDVPPVLPPAVSASPLPSPTPLAEVPEPATLILLGGGLLLTVWRMRP